MINLFDLAIIVTFRFDQRQNDLFVYIIMQILLLKKTYYNDIISRWNSIELELILPHFTNTAVILISVCSKFFNLVILKISLIFASIVKVQSTISMLSITIKLSFVINPFLEVVQRSNVLFVIVVQVPEAMKFIQLPIASIANLLQAIVKSTKSIKIVVLIKLSFVCGSILK